MSHPQPPQRQPTPPETQQYLRALHNTALIALVACPALALLPPRKLDFYTIGLAGTTVFSANYLIREQTGRSVWQHISRQSIPIAHDHNPTIQASGQSAAGLEIQNARARSQNGIETRVSMNEQVQSQREAWKAQRQQEIKDDLDEGKGFGDMIIDQIWEVWNWGKKRDDGDE